jgi:hypothetical protein
LCERLIAPGEAACMNSPDKALLGRRFELREAAYICERFEKSPSITEECIVSHHLRICYALRDAPILPLIREPFLQAYRYAKDWFGCEGDMALALWMAPELADLQYMTCLPCEETFFCAPGCRNGMGIILFVSPPSCRTNGGKDRLPGLFAHEITHYFVRDISHATEFSMKRKAERDVPMWLEEGLAQIMDSEMCPPLSERRAGKIARITKWYDREEMWNDLSSCEDPATAYLQAYKETKALMETIGKSEIIRLLHLNRTHEVDWTDVPRPSVRPHVRRRTKEEGMTWIQEP